MIKFGLYPHAIAEGEEESYRAIVHSQGTLDLEDVIEMMIDRGSTITTVDALAVLREFFSTVIKLMLMGYRIATPLAIFGLSIRGLFQSPLDSFDTAIHTPEPTITPTKYFRGLIKTQAKLQKKKVAVAHPQLAQCINHNNGDGNNVLTPGGGAELLGDYLKFDPADEEQGIFLVPTNGNGTGDQTPSRVEVTMRNTNGNLIFMVPAGLTTGEYRLEVRARFGQELRIGAYKEVLTVS